MHRRTYTLFPSAGEIKLHCWIGEVVVGSYARSVYSLSLDLKRFAKFLWSISEAVHCDLGPDL